MSRLLAYANPVDSLFARAEECPELQNGISFICLNLVEWPVRIDPARLERGLQRLAERHPVATGRLQRGSLSKRYAWLSHSDAKIPWKVVDLDDDDFAAIERAAGDVVNTPYDPERDPPLECILLRRPNAGDVLLTRFSHVLMDGKAVENMLAEASRLADEEPFDDRPSRESAIADPTGRSLMQSIVIRCSWRERWKSLSGYFRRQLGARRTQRFAPGQADRWTTSPLKLKLYALSPAETDCLVARAKSVFRFESLQPALIAAAFRAMNRTVPAEPDAQYRCATALALRPPTSRLPLFGNVISTAQFQAGSEELGPRQPGAWEPLAKTLHGRFGEWIRRRLDVGYIQTISLTQFNGPIMRRLIAQPRNMGVSFFFGYQGRLNKSMDQLFGARPSLLSTGLTCPSPPGMSLQFNLAYGRLHICQTYVSSVIAPETADRFRSELVAELTNNS